jgi:hypothetical protein
MELATLADLVPVPYGSPMQVDPWLYWATIVALTTFVMIQKPGVTARTLFKVRLSIVMGYSS